MSTGHDSVIEKDVLKYSQKYNNSEEGKNQQIIMNLMLFPELDTFLLKTYRWFGIFTSK